MQLSVAVPEPLTLVLSRVQVRPDCAVTCRLIVEPNPYWSERVRVVVPEEPAWTLMDPVFEMVKSGKLSERHMLFATMPKVVVNCELPERLVVDVESENSIRIPYCLSNVNWVDVDVENCPYGLLKV